MKINRIILAAVLVMSVWMAKAQSQFDKFEDIEGVTSVIVNQKAFSLMSKIGSESDEEYLSLIQNIESLKVFATESVEVAKQMEAEVKKYLMSRKANQKTLSGSCSCSLRTEAKIQTMNQ